MDRRIDEVVSDNERLRQANDALRARIERHGGIGGEPAARPLDPAETAGWMRRYVEAALDAGDAGLALFTDEGRLVAVNQRLAALFPDVAPRLSPGMRFEEAVRSLAGAHGLALADAGARAAWTRARMAAHGRAASAASAALVDGRWIEIAERRTAGGGFALSFRDGAPPAAPAVAGDAPALAAALDLLPHGLAVFDDQSRMTACNGPFRALLGLADAALRPGAALAALMEAAVHDGALEGGAGMRRLALWASAEPPRRPLSLELVRADGVALSAHARDLAPVAQGMLLRLSDVTEERRAALEVERVRRTLESRVEERTAALVEVNDRLVQEVAERRAIEAEMRRARDAAETANLSKTRFLAAASHDLLQPLNAARLFLSALSASPLPPAEASLALKIESAFASVETLLNALLDISKLDAGGGEAQVIDFPLSRIFGPVSEEFRAVAAERGLKLRIAPTRAVVRSDPHYLRRIVQNLVSNALKYTVAGGVVVGARRRGGVLRIEVWDSGVGIPPAERRRIFEEFHRIDHANPRGERGMGLGLAIVDRASRLLNHAVDIRSAEGRGSVFAVSVPLGAPSRAEPEAVAVGPAHADPGEGGMIAMVIEDDDAVRAATVALLTRWGVDVLEAASGDEAMALAQQFGMAPDVLLLDYHLGGGETGVDALGRLRAAFAAPIPAILITADRTRDVAAEAARAGAQLLTKPVAPAKLRALLHWSRGVRVAAG